MSECIICTNNIDAIERLYCIVICNHNNICNICYMRIRSLQKNFSCMICKRDLEHIVCYSKNQSITYTDFEMWGDKLVGTDSVLDLNSQMFYPNEYYEKVVSKLWIYKCNVCSKTYRDMKLLKTHVTNEHQMQLCIHCIENKHVFPSEQKLYNQIDYEKHLRYGDNDGSTGHPNCEFCKKRYYDSTALFIHLNKDHYTCHICERNDIKFKYYKDYKSLEQHFRRGHIICEDAICLAKKYVVFENVIDFELHNRQYHPTFQTKRNTSLKLDFKLARGSQKNNDELIHKEDRTSSSSSSSRSTLQQSTIVTMINDSSSKSSKYEGGLGGKEKDGEWQLEIKPTSTDPRDIDRNNSNTSSSILRNYSSSEALNLSHMKSSIEEEFPSLKAETSPNSNVSSSGVITITNKWVSVGGSNGLSSNKQRSKKQDYPELPNNKASLLDSTKSKKKSTTTTSSSSSSMISMIEKEYDSLSTSSAAPQQQMIGSLSDWARIKPQKSNLTTKKQATTSTAITNTSTNNKQTNDIVDYQSSGSGTSSKRNELSHEKLEDNIYYTDNYESSLSYALAQSMKDATPSSNTLNYSAVSNTDRNKLANTIEYPDLATTNNKISFTTSTTTNNSTSSISISNKNIKTNPKKQQQQTIAMNNIGGWGDAMQSVGLKLYKKPVTSNKLTVVKPTTITSSLLLFTKSNSSSSNSISNQDDSSSSINQSSSVKGDSTFDLINLKSIGKLSNDNLFIMNDTIASTNNGMKKITSIDKNMKTATSSHSKEDNLFNFHNIPKVPSNNYNTNTISPPPPLIGGGNNHTTNNSNSAIEGKNQKQYGCWVKIGGSSSTNNTTTTIINQKEYPSLS